MSAAMSEPSETREITADEIEQCKAVLGGLYHTTHDPRLILPLPNQVAHIVKLVTAIRPEFVRSVPVRATDYDEMIPQVIVQLLQEVERLRAENQAFRDQFREADEIIAEWDGFMPTNPPPGWVMSADTDGFTGAQ